MNLVVLSVVVVASLIAVLAIYLFATGALLSRVASNLNDCLQNVKTIGRQADVIGPGVLRLNRIGRDVVDALPLLYGGAERLAGTSPGAPAVVPAVGYLDVEPSPVAPVAERPAPAAVPAGVGYLDV